MRRFLQGIGLLALVALGFWGYRTLFPGDEARIRRLFRQLVEAAAVQSTETPLKRLATASKLAGYFTTDVVISLNRVGASWANLTGRSELQQALLAARANVQQLKIDMPGVTVELNTAKDAAIAEATALATVNGEPDAILQELRFTLRKLDGRWLISRVEPLEGLDL